MGNCWPKPVDNLPNTSTTNTRAPSPVHNSNDAKMMMVKNRQLQNAPPPTDRGGGGAAATAAAVPPSGEIVIPNLKSFKFAELRSATRNFRPDTVLGEGGFGTVYKGYIDQKTYAPSRVGIGIPVAVKKSNPDSEQGLKEWQAEVKFLGKYSHPNLVKLIGYCWEERQFLLVYEYMQRGSLESHLFRKGGEPIPWDIRMKIATGAARGLAFLHSTEKQVIYRDFKASNILLDGEFNAKLSDFGLAKLGPIDGNSHVTTKVVGTYGYAAPEYLATGHLYVKSDVYGFGVVLLEIITGLQVLDLNRPGGQANLVDWAKPSLPDKKKLRKLIDPRFLGQYPFKAAVKTAELILNCIELDPKRRPDMEQVLEVLEKVNSIPMKPKESKPKLGQNGQHHHHYQPQHHSHHGGGGAKGNGGGNRQHNNLNAAMSY